MPRTNNHMVEPPSLDEKKGSSTHSRQAISGTTIVSPSQVSPPSLIITNDNTEMDDNDTETNFFKVLSENLKYSVNSPVPNTQFPTPYSSNQDPNRLKTLQSHSQSQQGNSLDSSILENSINTGLYSNQGPPSQSLPQTASSITSRPVVNLNPDNNGNGETLDDMNIQPSSVLQFNNFPNEFLLASPEQLKEFIFDSPGGFNFFHNKTPAKTPLRFLTDPNGINLNLNSNTKSTSSSNLIHLFNSVNNNNDDQMVQDGNNNNGSASYDKNFNGTPLRKIDINLMFNSLSNSISPSKKLSMSLTPYGRRILNDIGTPFTNKNLNNNSSSNSALVDFQKARKDINSNNQLHSTPDGKLRVKNNNKQKSNKLTKVNLNKISKPTTINDHIQKSNKSNKNTKSKKKSMKNSNYYNDDDFENDNDDIYGSSPTTIQLNSSVTKSISRLDNHRIPNLKNSDLMHEKLSGKLFERLPLSPTPKSHTMVQQNIVGTLQVPELPKMGSFRSDTANNISNPISLPPNMHNKSNNNVSLGSSVMSLSSATSTLALSLNNHTNHINNDINSNANNTNRVKKVKKIKPKQPKFQVFVSSINKFNEPNSFVPLSPKSSKRESSKLSNKLKRSQSVLLKKNNNNNENKNNTKVKASHDKLKPKRTSSLNDNENFYNMY